VHGIKVKNITHCQTGVTSDEGMIPWRGQLKLQLNLGRIGSYGSLVKMLYETRVAIFSIWKFIPQI
jgi:hypothetical protein